MPAPTTAKGRLAAEFLATELRRLGRADLLHVLCFSDAAWRRAMAQSGCPAYAARLAPAPPPSSTSASPAAPGPRSPTPCATRRSTSPAPATATARSRPPSAPHDPFRPEALEGRAPFARLPVCPSRSYV